MRMIIVATAASLAAAAPAHAENVYGKLFGGVVFGADHDIAANLPGVASGDGELETETGFGLGGAVGFRASELFSFEGEVAYRSNDVEGGFVDDVAFDGEGDFNALSFMANGVLTAPGVAGFAPYAGLGVGGARLGGESDHDIVLAYQGFAGVSKSLNANWDAGVEYRYFDTRDAKLEEGAGHMNVDYTAHAVNFVLTRRF